MALWILRKEQAAYSEPVVRAAGVPVRVTANPTSYGVKNSALGALGCALGEAAGRVLREV